MVQKQVFKPKSRDADYMLLYQALLEDSGQLHKYAVEWVKEQDIFTNEGAIHAMAFTIWKEAMDRMASNPNLVIYFPPKEAKQNLIDFQLYRKTVADPMAAFVELTAEVIGYPIEKVQEMVTLIPDMMDRKEFFKQVKRYDQLAEGIKAWLDGDKALAEKCWVNSTMER